MFLVAVRTAPTKQHRKQIKGVVEICLLHSLHRLHFVEGCSDSTSARPTRTSAGFHRIGWARRGQVNEMDVERLRGSSSDARRAGNPSMSCIDTHWTRILHVDLFDKHASDAEEIPAGHHDTFRHFPTQERFVRATDPSDDSETEKVKSPTAAGFVAIGIYVAMYLLVAGVIQLVHLAEGPADSGLIRGASANASASEIPHGERSHQPDGDGQCTAITATNTVRPADPPGSCAPSVDRHDPQ